MDPDCTLKSNKKNILKQKSTRIVENTLTSLVFTLSFFSLVYLFNHFDYYNLHFFDSGLSPIIYNFTRTIFALYIIWFVYYIGYATLCITPARQTLKEITFLERLIAGFGVGIGIWHIFMLTLGLLNLYYQSIVVGACLAITYISATHFKNFSIEAINILKKPTTLNKTTKIIIACCLFLLLITKGLYPGGGGDYFTHYFYYNLSVIKNHGIAPNDVWYHYYYSKGTGLQFLGMILMDPESPALVTFCCVFISTLAIINLISKISPTSYWPCFAGVLYVLYNIVPVTGDGVDFQKTHEITTSILVLGLWAVCHYELSPRKWGAITFTLLSSLVIAGAIITQAITIIFTLYLSILCGISLLSRNYKKFFFYFAVCTIATISVLSIFILNYLVTGLITDQGLSFTWKYANLEKLNQWGVIPNIIMVMWVRHNYELVETPWEFVTILKQFIHFSRIDVLWITIVATLTSVIAMLVYIFRRNQAITTQLMTQIDRKRIEIDVFKNYDFKIVSKNSLRICFLLAIAILVFSIASIFIGHSQEVSYFRFSSFLFPTLLLLLTVTLAITTKNWPKIGGTLAIILVVATVSTWPNWPKRALRMAHHAKRFVIGKYSLASAYKHLPFGLPFGGVNPDAYSAFKQTPAGSRLWATNVDSYCMAPDCIIESVFSFKLSQNLDRVMLASPETAKNILKDEGLNYFLVLKNAKMYDILPYSQLFSPNNIGKHLGIKWTNGNAYLLTWSENADTKIDQSFLSMYKKLIKEAEHPWFRFKELIPELEETMSDIKSTGHPMKSVQMSWIRKEKNKIKEGIKIHHASYGRNCRISKDFPFVHLISASNATELVKSFCQNKHSCSFRFNRHNYQQFSKNCSKEFSISYYCRPSSVLKRVEILAPENGDPVRLSC